jgi:pyruvate/2-oxoglutarate dehydrogenase complex dihydrolipoamide dehydrogenase (E3) component
MVIIGGGRVGCETAEFLTLKGKSVTLIEEGDEVGRGVPPRIHMFLLPRLIKKGVKILKKTKVEEIEDSGVKVFQPGKVEKIEADTVVIAMGFIPRTALVDGLEAMIPELNGFFMIGDCAEPRTVQEAIRDGWRIGRII